MRLCGTETQSGKCCWSRAAGSVRDPAPRTCFPLSSEPPSPWPCALRLGSASLQHNLPSPWPKTAASLLGHGWCSVPTFLRKVLPALPAPPRSLEDDGFNIAVPKSLLLGVQK